MTMRGAGEPTTIELIKQYKPETNSLCSGQVLQCPYNSAKAKLVVREMTDLLVLDLVEKHLVTDQLTLTIGYDIENLTNPKIASRYKGEVKTDRYGRKVPKHAHGTSNLNEPSSSTKQIIDAVMELYDRIIDRNLLVRRITVAANRLTDEAAAGARKQEDFVQMGIFTDYEELEKQKQENEAKMKRSAPCRKPFCPLKRNLEKCHPQRHEPGGGRYRRTEKQPDRRTSGIMKNMTI